MIFAENIISVNIIKNIMNKGLVLITTSRGKLIEMDALLFGL